MKSERFLFLALILSLSLVGCAKNNEIAPVTLSNIELASQRIDMQPATVVQCADGGTELRTYLDANGNGLLDAEETILESYVVCSGADGKNGADGSNGRNGQDGSDGQNGFDGKNAYAVVFKISSEAPGCKTGGSTMSFALDTNENGMFDEKDEHTQSIEICNGIDGANRTDDFTRDEF